MAGIFCIGGDVLEFEQLLFESVGAEKRPIIQNAKLPIYKQKQEYKLMFCKDKFSCPLYLHMMAIMGADDHTKKEFPGVYIAGVMEEAN